MPMRRARQRIEPTTRAGGINIAIPTGTPYAHALSNVAQTLGGISDKMQRDKEWKLGRDAKRKGKQAGIEGGYELLEETPTAQGRLNAMFNDSYKVSMLNTSEIAARKTIGELKNQFISDPMEFQNQAGSYMQGMISDIAERTPEVAGILKQRMATVINSALNQIRKNHTAVVRDETQANVIQLGNLMSAEMTQYAADLYSEDKNVSAETYYRAASDLEQIKLVYEQIGPDGQPVFSEVAKIKGINHFKDQFHAAAVKGFILKNGITPKFYTQLKKGELSFDAEDDKGNVIQVNPMFEMSQSAYNGIISFAESELRDYNNQQRLADKVAAKEEKTLTGYRTAQMWDQVTSPDTPLRSTEVVKNAVRDGHISAQDGEGMIKFINKDRIGPLRDDPATLDLIDRMYYNKEDIRDLLNDPNVKITSATRTKYRSMFYAQADTGHVDIQIAERQNLKDAITYSDISIAAKIKSMSDPLWDAKYNARRADAITEYNARTDAGEPPVEVRRDLQDRFRREAATKSATNGLLKPRNYVMNNDNKTLNVKASQRQIAALLKNKRLTVRQSVEQYDLIKSWQDIQVLEEPKPKVE